MLAPTLGAIPRSARRRLFDHYGPAVLSWLDGVPDLTAEAASRWGLTLVGYHDAGCASIVAIARTTDNRLVLVKAWYEHGRYAHEMSVLRIWRGRRVPDVLHEADDLGVAVIELVAGRPGGRITPPGDLEAVALALADLHNTPCPSGGFPRLDEYLHSVVLPRISRRRRTVGGDVSAWCEDTLHRLHPPSGTPTLLHGDLYRENVLFDADSRPVFVDPLPMIGSSAFDWAFWVVYYDLFRDPYPRLRLAAAIGDVPLNSLAPWCLCLAVDGLLYYREVGDSRASRMADVITSLRGRCAE